MEQDYRPFGSLDANRRPVSALCTRVARVVCDGVEVPTGCCTAFDDKTGFVEFIEYVGGLVRVRPDGQGPLIVRRYGAVRVQWDTGQWGADAPPV